MSRSLRRGSIAAIAALAIASLSACAAGNSAETLEVKPDTASATVGNDLRLNNIVVVTGDESSGKHTGPANLTVNISNTGALPAILQSVTVDAGTATFADASGAPTASIVIPPNGAVAIGGAGNPTARIASATLEVGGFVPTTFAFDSGAKAEADANVYPNKGYFAGYGPAGAARPATPATPASPAAATPAVPAAPTGPAAPGATTAPATAPAAGAATAAATSTTAAGH
ncbi:DUF461 domain-containing protein [Kitasatospora sp. NPDC050543]|uniref:DUF461 domain-containing protein n=1 Tax=Kitasatospora sp. NPDC050543 TaxID=3364054 RepID=UPI0037BB83C5